MEALFDLKEMSQKQAHDKQNGMFGQDILSVSQFDKDKLSFIFHRAREMREMVEQVGGADLLLGRVLACLFYEPSTRTSASFISAMERLGGSVIPITQ
ncbi:MAG TPA: aspartate carbamoyltransferase, partial [Anaerolineae bacterium]|nr:aspartate carbamoyltransferase [Anaerolineae bacterium]